MRNLLWKNLFLYALIFTIACVVVLSKPLLLQLFLSPFTVRCINGLHEYKLLINMTMIGDFYSAQKSDFVIYKCFFFVLERNRGLCYTTISKYT